MRVLVLGGASQIGLAIVEAIAADGPVEAVLAARPGSAHIAQSVEKLESAGIAVETLDFDAVAPETHRQVIERAFERRVDVAVVAFGLLGDEDTWRRHDETVALAGVNFTAALSAGALLAEQMSAQRLVDGSRGRIVALSSVAGERVRQSNFVYGATKRGMDAYYLKLGDALAKKKVQVLVVRPGVVATRMVAGRPRVPLTSTPQQVGSRVAQAMKSGATMIRVPRLFGPVMAVFKLMPRWLARKLGL